MFLNEVIWAPMDIGLFGFFGAVILGIIAMAILFGKMEYDEYRAKKKAEAEKQDYQEQ